MHGQNLTKCRTHAITQPKSAPCCSIVVSRLWDNAISQPQSTPCCCIVVSKRWYKKQKDKKNSMRLYSCASTWLYIMSRQTLAVTCHKSVQHSTSHIASMPLINQIGHTPPSSCGRRARHQNWCEAAATSSRSQPRIIVIGRQHNWSIDWLIYDMVDVSYTK